jgi:hypothetical protein
MQVINKSSEEELEEWKWKCGQLELTVSRLMRQVEQLRKERDDLLLETVATGTANLVFGFNNDESDAQAVRFFSSLLSLSLSLFRALTEIVFV